MNQASDHEALMSLVEQAQAIAQSWLESLPATERRRGETCPSVEILGQYLSGALASEQAVPLAAHLGDCRHCRMAARQERMLRDAEAGTGDCVLGFLRDLIKDDPDRAARALVRLSRRIQRLVSDVAPEKMPPRRIEAAVVDLHGKPLGTWLPLVIERAARVHSDKTLRLQVRVEEAPPKGCRLRLSLADESGQIELGAAEITEGSTTIVADLSDLNVPPGYVSPEPFRIVLECSVREEPRSVVGISDSNALKSSLITSLPGSGAQSPTITTQGPVRPATARRKLPPRRPTEGKGK
jgi:hypothetical protein